MSIIRVMLCASIFMYSSSLLSMLSPKDLKELEPKEQTRMEFVQDQGWSFFRPFLCVGTGTFLGTMVGNKFASAMNAKVSYSGITPLLITTSAGIAAEYYLGKKDENKIARGFGGVFGAGVGHKLGDFLYSYLKTKK